jgi:hypothetical protein
MDGHAIIKDPTLILQAQKWTADPWQIDLLNSTDQRILLNCARQSGKSTTVAAMAMHTVIAEPNSLILLLSPSLRQSVELFRKVRQADRALAHPLAQVKSTATELEFDNGSRIVCLPANEETIRCFSKVALLVLDEASRVPDDIYSAVRPMLAVSSGRLICLSTPYGKRGFFYREWHDHDAAWRRVRVTWRDFPRIPAQHIEDEKRSLGESWVRQEYECSFEALSGLVYPDFADRVACDDWPNPQGRPIGGIDFGFRSPFCALWGVHDRDDVLWISDERYLRHTSISEHALALPRRVHWFADPSGAGDIAELRRANLIVLPAQNDIRSGIAAVTARIETGRLRVRRAGCPNLLAEAELYRYPKKEEGAETENPVDDSNHATDALRYLISRLDIGFMARVRRKPETPGGSQRPWLSVYNEFLWKP